VIKKFALIALVASANLAFAISDPVKIDTGLVSGKPGSNASIQAYEGIPYATPPVGNLRWHAPLPAAPWQGVLKADHFGNNCMQANYKPEVVNPLVDQGKSPWSDEYYAWREPLSEDCLYINVWTPAHAPGDKLPVLVFVHGGGFVQGSGSVDIYNGEGLASKGIIVVTLNYRVGIFAYFAHPDLRKESEHNVSGNYGVMDQIAALQWVHRNIAAFGGDPANVTIDGQSAGSRSISYLVSTPLTHGLFARAISQSGGMFAPSNITDNSASPYMKDSEEKGVKFAQDMNAKSIAELRALPAADIVKYASLFRPVIDGYVFPADEYTTFSQGKQNDVPMMIGWDQGDGTPFANNFGLPEDAAGFKEAAVKLFGPMAPDFLKAFPVTTDADAVIERANAARDWSFAWNMRTWARLQAKTGKNKLFLYYWDHVSPVKPITIPYGAFHSSEIPYAFNNLDTWRLNWRPEDRHMSEIMSGYWVNFIKTGDPNGKGLPAWTVFDPKNEQSLHFADKVGMFPTPLKQELDFFDAWFASRRK